MCGHLTPGEAFAVLVQQGKPNEVGSGIEAANTPTVSR